MSADAPVVARPVTERYDPTIPALVHGGWLARMPWLVQGTTTRGTGEDAFDLGLHSGGTPQARVRENWDRLLAATGMRRAVHARQVHEAEVRVHRAAMRADAPDEECDGHATVQAGLLLAVTVADCVPTFIVSARPRAVAVVHAGWRGVAAGVLERGLSVLADEIGVAPSGFLVHLGPSICGRCYEVGPEVFSALGQPVPEGPTPIDLRAILASRAESAGVRRAAISSSTHCTRCTASGLFSHRGGDRGRQVGYLGIGI